MKIKKIFFLIIFLALPSAWSHAISLDDNYQSKANFICNQIIKEPSFNHEEYFAQKFIEAVPYEYMKSILSGLHSEFGRCDKALFVKEEKGLRYFNLELSENVLAKVLLGLEKEAPYKISTLFIQEVTDPKVVIRSWNDLEKIAKKQHGLFSATLQVFSDPSKNYNIKGSIFQALGSSFKLYILGNLLKRVGNGEFTWNQQFPIKPEWKSLPSGIMHTWPDGKKVSLEDYASYMISISDNTATDHLLNILGRTNIESHLSKMGNSFLFQNRPFLSTLEMFKIKWALPIEQIHTYIAASEEQKRLILNSLMTIPTEQIGQNGVPFDKPAFIRDIEWFGSTNDLCDAMNWIRSKSEILKDDTSLKILAKNTPFVQIDEDSHWEYAGYKSGSEPGVLTMAYILKSKTNQWGCLSVALNDKIENVSQYRVSDIVKKTIKFSQTIIQ